MSYSPITGAGDGTAPVVNLTFPLIAKGHLKATADGVEVPFTWTAPSQITFDDPVAAGVPWVVFRQTPIDPLIDFTDETVLTAEDMNLVQTQVLYRHQELEDRVENVSDAAEAAEAATEAAALAIEAADDAVEAVAGVPAQLLGKTDAATLAGAGGAALVGYRATGIGAVTRPASSKLLDAVSVRDFGAVGDGAADDTAAIQAALNSGHTAIIFPATASGTVYRTTAKLTVPSKVELHGKGKWTAVIQSDDVDAPILELATGASDVVVRGLRLAYSGTPVLGADAIVGTSCQTCSFLDLWISSCWNGIRLIGGGNHAIVNFRCYSYENAAYLSAGATDVFLSTFRFHAGDSIKGRAGGIRLEGPTEGFVAVAGDITLGVYSMTTATYGTNARGEAPYYNRFIGVLFDSAKQQGAYLRSLAHTDFVGCWFASAGFDAAVGNSSMGDYSGVDLDQCSHVRFIGGDAYGNGGRGALVYSTNKFIRFAQMSLKRNGFRRGVNYPAIEFLAGTTDFAVTDCLFERDADIVTYRQTQAVTVGAGASDRYFIKDNLLGGCVLSDSGTGVNKSVGTNF